MNKLIVPNNAEIAISKFYKNTEYYKHGCLYGNVKTNKRHSSLIAILLQLATFSDIISPSIRNDYSIIFTKEFLQILNTTPTLSHCTLALLNSENLTVNERNIIICDGVYKDNSISYKKETQTSLKIIPCMHTKKDFLQEILREYVCSKPKYG